MVFINISTLFILTLLMLSNLVIINAIISCNTDEDCNISCEGNRECLSETIQCPIDYKCTIACTGTLSCVGITINASLSSELIINGCSDSSTCSLSEIYCPINNSTKKCSISGNNNIRLGINYYAINGWADINVNYTGDYSVDSSIMYCLSDYSISCSLANHSFECNPNGDISCNNGITPSPTQTTSLPTTYPTTVPTTNQPTIPTATPMSFKTTINRTISTTTVDCGTGHSAADTCYITCSYVQDNAALEANCGDVGKCYIDCDEQKCLRDGIINATLANSLEIFGTGRECLKGSHIYLPYNGNATIIIDTQGSYGMDGIIKQAFIHSQFTDYIHVECNDPLRDDGTKDICRELNILAADATHLSVIINGADMYGGAVIECPTNSILEPSCIINATNGAVVSDLVIDAGNGTMPKNVQFYGGTGNLFFNINFWCENGQQSIQYDTTLGTFNGTGVCWVNPTQIPTTFTPTTTAPTTVNPTTNPTTSIPTTITPTTTNPTITNSPTTTNPT
eukprot:473939_1